MRKITTTIAALAGALVIAGCAQPTIPASSPAPELVAAPAPAPIDSPQPAESTEPAKLMVLDAPPAGTADAPATQPASPLKEWVNGSAKPAQTEPKPDAPATPALPSGHPDISKMTRPAMGGQLPAGHPDISKLTAPATTQPVIGSLTIRAAQGTAGGPAIGAEPVNVEVYVDGEVTGKLDTKLQDDGTVKVQGVPVGPGVQAIVKVTHAGVEFQAIAQADDASQKDQQVTIPVFESTDQVPAWTVQMRHVIVEPFGDAVNVVEMLAIQNPTDKAWTGVADSSSGKRATFTLPLPQGATNITLSGGFHDCCVNTDGGKLTNTMALIPGVTQYQVAYSVPAKDGKATLTAAAPAPVKQMMVFVRGEHPSVVAQGMEGPKTANMGNGDVTYFTATDLEAGKEVKLTVAAAGVPVRKAAAPGSTAATGQIVKALAGAGGLLILVLGGAFMFIRAPKSVKKTSE
jgi:hypothetical protein